MRFSNSSFFHQSTPPRGITNWGNSFLPIGHSSRRKSNFSKLPWCSIFHGVCYTAEVMLHRGSHFCGVCYITEVTSKVYATPRKSLLRCSIHRRSLLNILVKTSPVYATSRKSLPRCMLQHGSSPGAEYRRKYEFSRKKLSPRQDQGTGAIDWRNKKNPKISCQCPFK